jgi:secondary thiamine-phosphate synthase enzyme
MLIVTVTTLSPRMAMSVAGGLCMQTSFNVRTPTRTCFLNITREVERAIEQLGVEEGAVLIHVPHTTAAVTINENADPDVVTDLESTLNALVPRSDRYRHTEGNSDAHVKSSLVGCSQTVLVDGGAPVLGTWQGIFFCEFDGPRSRRVIVGTFGGA